MIMANVHKFSCPRIHFYGRIKNLSKVDYAGNGESIIEKTYKTIKLSLFFPSILNLQPLPEI